VLEESELRCNFMLAILEYLYSPQRCRLYGKFGDRYGSVHEPPVLKFATFSIRQKVAKRCGAERQSKKILAPVIGMAVSTWRRALDGQDTTQANKPFWRHATCGTYMVVCLLWLSDFTPSQRQCLVFLSGSRATSALTASCATGRPKQHCALR
jgi:hypothetical protein